MKRAKRGPPGGPATVGGCKAKTGSADNREARESASLSSNATTSGRQNQDHPQDRETTPNFLADLDTACTSAAVVANRLAATTRLLEAHVRAGLPFGPEVARVVRMALMAAEATEMLHQVARDYADWMVA